MLAFMHEHAHGEVACSNCGHDFSFELPAELVTECREGNLVIFAGAGISTEVPAVFPTTLYEETLAQVELESGSFPEVMQAFEEKYGRQALAKSIKKKFDYVDSFPRTRRTARKFHQELATIPFLKDIVTTNWDTYFEDECFATPIVKGDDVALLDLYDRRVFKLHGSILNLSSMVITKEDYDESLRRLGNNVLGAHVKQLLSAKTVVFIGYSLSDSNFLEIYESLRSDLGKFAPRAYYVSPFPTKNADSLDLVFLQTSGVKFLSELKSALGQECLIGDEKYDDVATLQGWIFEADEYAKSAPHAKYPAVVYCWDYHDGVMDGCFRILNRRASGEYSDRHRVHHLLQTYAHGSERANQRGHFRDAAYMEGYVTALLALLSDDFEDIVLDELPLYFVYGAESSLRTKEHFRADLEKSRRRAPKQRAYARTFVERLPANMVLEHNRILPDLFE